MRYKNLTPHEITLVRADGTERRVPPSGAVARVATRTVLIGEVDGIPVGRAEYGPVEGLPEQEEGVILLVSSMVLDRIHGRPDVMAPDTGPESVVRDDGGKITGVRRLRIGGDT